MLNEQFHHEDLPTPPVSTKQTSQQTLSWHPIDTLRQRMFSPSLTSSFAIPSLGCLSFFDPTTGFCAIVAAVCFYKQAAARRQKDNVQHQASLLKGSLQKKKERAQKLGWKAFEKKYGAHFPSLGIDQEKIKAEVLTIQIERLCKEEISYKAFLSENGRDAFRSLPPSTLGQFHFPFLDLLQKQNLGYDDVNHHYRDAIQAFGITDHELVDLSLRQHLRIFLSTSMPYLDFRNNNHASSFSLLTLLEKEALKNDPRPAEEFFSLSYEEMVSDAYVSDREFFGWSRGQIDRSLQKDLETMSYHALTEKHGRGVFSENPLWQQKVVEAVAQAGSLEELGDLPPLDLLSTLPKYERLLVDWIEEKGTEFFLGQNKTVLTSLIDRGAVPKGVLEKIETTQAAIQKINTEAEKQQWTLYDEYSSALDHLAHEQEQAEETIRHCLETIEELQSIGSRFHLDESEHWLAIDRELEELHDSQELETMELAFADERAKREVQWIEDALDLEKVRFHRTYAVFQRDWRV